MSLQQEQKNERKKERTPQDVYITNSALLMELVCVLIRLVPLPLNPIENFNGIWIGLMLPRSHSSFTLKS